MRKPLFNLPDNAYQYWKPFELDGNEYSFEHLNSCKKTFNRPGVNETYTIYFTFSHHVFTTSLGDGATNDEYLYPFSKNDTRAFCLDRYKLSMHLPTIIDTLPEQYFYHGGYGRYCCCKVTEGNQDVFYQVVYRTWKERGKMRFHIESAYPLSEWPNKTKKVRFWVICHNLLKNKKLPKPHK